MVAVVGVHGIAQEQRGRNQLLGEWGPGLADGVEAAAGKHAVVPSFDLSYYGGLFLSAADQGVAQPPGKGAAALGADVLSAPVSGDDLDFMESAVSEIEAALPDLGQAMGAPPVPRPLRPLTQRLTRRLRGQLVLQTLSVLRQVKLYLDDDGLAARIRGRIESDLADGDVRVVIAHSLGTVVAYETLVLNTALAVPVLVTVGSPLGMRGVASRLRQAGGGRGGRGGLPVMPAALGRWVNIYDPGDPVAAAGGLSRLWPAVADYTVGNGKDPHAIRSYLGKQITGRTVLDGVA